MVLIISPQHHDKTGLLKFLTSKAQTGLHGYRDQLDSSNFGNRNHLSSKRTAIDHTAQIW